MLCDRARMEMNPRCVIGLCWLAVVLINHGLGCEEWSQVGSGAKNSWQLSPRLCSACLEASYASAAEASSLSLTSYVGMFVHTA